MPDSEIVSALHAGEEAGLSALYGRYAQPLKRYAQRLLADEQEAEDLVQEAFLRFLVLVRNGLFDPARGTVQALVYRIVRNLCLDRLRQPGPAIPLSGAEAAQDGQSHPEARARVRLAEAALASLPAPQRAALLMRVREGCSYEEIARRLGATLAQVKTWIFRARCSVRRSVGGGQGELPDERDIDSEG